MWWGRAGWAGVGQDGWGRAGQGGAGHSILMMGQGKTGLHTSRFIYIRNQGKLGWDRAAQSNTGQGWKVGEQSAVWECLV